MATRTSTATGNWSAGGTWVGGIAPVAGDDAIIASGHTVTVDDTSRAALTCTVNGTLRRSRTASNTLALSGNLVLNSGGVYDSGLISDRIPDSIVVRTTFSLVEANYVGGGMVPLATDVGYWGVGSSQTFIHGAIKDAWTKLAAAANAGATTCIVNGIYTQGWAAGDRIVLTDTHYPTAGFNTQGDTQEEVRTITSISGAPGDATRTVTFSGGALAFDHAYVTSSFTTQFGDAVTDVLTAEVMNLSSNIVFDTADGTNTNAYHIMFTDTATFFVEDLRIVNASPRSRVNPMGRYVWHVHREEAASTGSYARRVKVEASKGGVLFNHESWGISYEDWALYNVATLLSVSGDQQATPVFFEDTLDPPIYPPHIRHSADNCRFDRFCVAKWGVTENQNFMDRAACFWLGFGSINCAVYGSTVSGGTSGFDSGAYVWPEGTNGLVQVLRVEAHANDQNGTFAHINTTPEGGQTRQIDWLMWRNFHHGMRDGAYITGNHHFFMRMIGNAQLATGPGGPVEVGQAHHSVTLRRVTNFLLDGENGTNANGIRVNPYVVDSTNPDLVGVIVGGTDSTYEDGVIRNIGVGLFDVIHGQTGGQNPIGSAISQVSLNRIAWSGRGFRFGNGTGGPTTGSPPFSSFLRFRGQTGMGGGRPANFTLYNIGDPAAPGGSVVDGNALRADSDTSGNGFLCPRAFLSMSVADDALEPAADAQGRRLVTLTCATRDGTAFSRPDAHSVVFYRDLTAIATVTPDGSGNATYQDDIATHPHRRAYYYAVASYTSGANTGGFNTTQLLRVRRSVGTTALEPTAPTLSTFTTSAPTTVNWTNTDVSNEVGYEYETSAAGVAPWTVRQSAGQNSVSASWTGASPNTTYHGRVSSVGPSATRYPSNVVGPITTAIATPASPTNLGFSLVTDTTLTFSFTDASGAAGDEESASNGFHHRRRTPPTSGTYGATVDANGVAGTGSTISFNVVGLSATTTYEFEAWASNATGESTRPTATITTAATPAVPGTPTLNTASASSPTQIDATWTNVATEQGYRLQSSPHSAGTWTTRATFAADTTSGSWVGASPATDYDIRVQAFNGVNTANSGTIEVITASAIPSPPINPRFTSVTQTSLNFLVTDNSGAAGDFETAFEGRYRDETGTPGAYITLTNEGAQASTGATITFAVAGLAAGRTYRFASRAINGTGNSAYAEATVTTTASDPPPTGNPPGGKTKCRIATFTVAMNRFRRRFWPE